MASTRPSSNRDEYLLGSQDAELQRLAFQHRVWAEQAFALWTRAGFRRGGAILDLGCGPGFAAVDLAHLVGPTGSVARWLFCFLRDPETVVERVARVVEGDLITPEERRAFEREWQERRQDPATRLFVPPMIDVVGIKRS